MADRRFLVTWEMDIFASSPFEAAEKALAVHRNEKSLATVFDVQEYDADTNQPTTRIDLESMEQKKDEN